MEISIDFFTGKYNLNLSWLSVYCPIASDWILHGNFHRQLVANNFWKKFNPRNWALHRNFHRFLVAKNNWNYFVKDRHLVAKKSETILVHASSWASLENFNRISGTFGYYMEISIGVFFGREYLNLSWLSLCCPSNLVLHGNFHRQLVANNFWKKLIQGIGHYIEISIDSLWQRISETILSKWFTLQGKYISNFLKHNKLFLCTDLIFFLIL